MPRTRKDSTPSTRRSKKTAVMLAQRIVSEITDQGLEPGTPLLSEKAMLEHYGVARGSLREALRYLETQGVITIRTGPGGGPTVAEPHSQHVAGTIAMFLQLSGAHFSDILDARAALEPILARQAALRARDDEIAALRASIERMDGEIDDLDTFLQENEGFHAIIAEAAGNVVFSLLIRSLNWIIDGKALGVDYPIDSRRPIVKAHRRIAQAIDDGDGDRAAAAMSLHIGEFERYLRRNYPAIVGMALRWDRVT